MANFTALKTAINNAIKTNGNEEITGAILQAILDAMVETLGDSAINDLENAITTEVTNRENAVGGVADDLAAEALARANKDNQLDGRINQEEYNRQNADAALSQTMSQGFQTLGSQMTALNAAISALNAAYQNGFLYGGIATPSSSPSNNKCFYIALQGGTYTNFGGVGVVEGINIIKNDSGWKVEHIYDQTTLLNEFYLLRQQVIRALASYEPIIVYGDVTNAPDEEDLTSNAQHLLKFKDRDYSPLNFSGLGMKILRKNILPLNDSVAFNGFLEGVTAEETLAGSPELIFWDRMNTRFVGIKDGIYYAAWTDDDNYVPVSTSLVYMYNGTPYQWTGSDFIVDETEVPNLVNCLTQDMINEANTIYIIRYDYTLKEDITIPSNCVLEFDGGSISGAYTLTGANTCIETGIVKVFGDELQIDGTFKNIVLYSEWFGISPDNNDNSSNFQKISSLIQGHIFQFGIGIYKFSSQVNLNGGGYYRIEGKSSDWDNSSKATILKANSNFEGDYVLNFANENSPNRSNILENFCVDCNNVSGGIYYSSYDSGNIKNVDVINGGSGKICVFITNSGGKIRKNVTQTALFENVWAYKDLYGDNEPPSMYIRGCQECTFINCKSAGGKYSCIIDHCVGCSFITHSFCSTIGVYLLTNTKISFIGCQFENCNTPMFSDCNEIRLFTTNTVSVLPNGTKLVQSNGFEGYILTSSEIGFYLWETSGIFDTSLPILYENGDIFYNSTYSSIEYKGNEYISFYNSQIKGYASVNPIIGIFKYLKNSSIELNQDDPYKYVIGETVVNSKFIVNNKNYVENNGIECIVEDITNYKFSFTYSQSFGFNENTTNYHIVFSGGNFAHLSLTNCENIQKLSFISGADIYLQAIKSPYWIDGDSSTHKFIVKIIKHNSVVAIDDIVIKEQQKNNEYNSSQTLAVTLTKCSNCIINSTGVGQNIQLNDMFFPVGSCFICCYFSYLYFGLGTNSNISLIIDGTEYTTDVTKNFAAGTVIKVEKVTETVVIVTTLSGNLT